MSTPSPGVGWAGVDQLPDSAVALHSAQEWEMYLALATDILWAATQRRWRSTSDAATVELRPAGPRPGESGGWPYRCGCGDRTCHWLAPPSWVASSFEGGHGVVGVRLPHSDVVTVTSVTIGGNPFQGWRLDGAWLTRTDGNAWPDCHPQTLVTYTFGKPPPVAGVACCVELAVELGRATSDDPDQQCRLPQRIQSVTRQGVSYEVMEDMEWLDRGLVGLPGVDIWLKSINPYGRAQAATVWSPDLATARRTS